MATNTAPTASSNGMPGPALWQAPVFVLGVLALAGVWFGRPLWQGNPAHRIDRDLAAARKILDRPEGDSEYALKLAQRCLDAADLPADKLGEAALLAGLARVRLASRAEALQARQEWPKARDILEQAEVAGVNEEDHRLLLYALGVAGFYTGDDLGRVIMRLEQGIDKADNKVQGYDLITQACLRMDPPDLNKALEANRKLRDVNEATEEEQTLAKLTGGEILLRMGKPHQARQSLGKITDSKAPPAILLKAHLLMARCFQKEDNWSDAIRYYVLATRETRVPLPAPAQVQYDLGVCYQQSKQPNAAAHAWQECLKQAQGPEGPAAALALAELRLSEHSLDQIPELLALAVAQVEPATGWKNPLVDLARATDLFERSIRALRDESLHDRTSRALACYARFAVPRRLLLLQAETKAEWARALAKKDPKPTDVQAEQINKLFVEAAEAYGKLADSPGVQPIDRAGFLWSCAQSAAASNNDERARVCLEEYVKLNLEPARMGEAWFQLGEVYRRAKQADNAGKAYRKCQEFDDIKAACRARFQLAMAALEANEPEEAEAALVLNLKMLRWDSEPVALPQTLFALGNLLYQRQQYSRLVRYLENALGQFKDHPDVYRARYQLADSYRQLGNQAFQNLVVSQGSLSDEARQHFKTQRNRWQQKAADEFATLEELLDTPEGKDALTPELRLQVPFFAAKCLRDAGQPTRALKIYEKLIERHAEKYEQIEALGGAVSCHDALKQYDKAKTRLLHIQTLLPKMPPEVRQPWQDWIKDASATIQQKGPETTAAAEPGDPVPGTTTVPGAAASDKVDRSTNAKPPAESTSIPNGGGTGGNPGTNPATSPPPASAAEGPKE